MYPDICITVLDAQTDGRVDLEIHVITSAVRSTALAMTSPCMKRLVDTYALYCARSGMLFRRAVRKYAQDPLDRVRAFQKKHNGVAWPLLREAHPAASLTAETAYLATVLEFMPEACTTAIYAALETAPPQTAARHLGNRS